jgi:AcrR family transcriptional regulator
MEGKKPRAKNRQVERTKGWIREALLRLMEEKPFDKITVQDIIDKAGIARRTFYYNYADKEAVALDYVGQMVEMRTEDDKEGNVKRIVLIIRHSYISSNRDILDKFSSVLSLKDSFVDLFQEYLNSVMNRRPHGLSDEEFIIYRYKVCYQLTGAVAVFYEWYKNGGIISPKHLAEVLNSMASPREARYRNVPVVEVRVE